MKSNVVLFTSRKSPAEGPLRHSPLVPPIVDVGKSLLILFRSSQRAGAVICKWYATRNQQVAATLPLKIAVRLSRKSTKRFITFNVR